MDLSNENNNRRVIRLPKSIKESRFVVLFIIQAEQKGLISIPEAGLVGRKIQPSVRPTSRTHPFVSEDKSLFGVFCKMFNSSSSACEPPLNGPGITNSQSLGGNFRYFSHPTCCKRPTMDNEWLGMTIISHPVVRLCDEGGFVTDVQLFCVYGIYGHRIWNI